MINTLNQNKQNKQKNNFTITEIKSDLKNPVINKVEEYLRQMSDLHAITQHINKNVISQWTIRTIKRFIIEWRTIEDHVLNKCADKRQKILINMYLKDLKDFASKI